jgi:hypothetical protein
MTHNRATAAGTYSGNKEVVLKKVLPFVLALVVLGATAAGAGASPASSSRATDLCTLAKSVRSSITKSGATVTPGAGTSIQALEAQLKSTYTHIKAAESLVLANSPASLKPHFVRVFAFDNKIYAMLSKANWNFLVFAKNAQSLSAQAAALKPDLAAIQAYFAKCKA